MKQETKPLVTIVTVTFNLLKSGREKFFRQCLESVHGQAYENIEHLIIDGASNDGTTELIKEYADKGWIKYVSEPDAGIYDAMNKGIKLAKGKYIAFLNSDDFYHNADAVRLSVDLLEKKQADFSYADYVVMEDGGVRIMRACLEKFIFTMPFGHPTMFTRTSVIREEGGFDEKYSLPADYDLAVRLILKDRKGAYLNDRIASYRIGGSGSTTDHSDEIARIYCDNYSVFHGSLTLEQAKKIMYEARLPAGFTANFRNYAIGKKYKNMDVDKVVRSLLDNLSEEEEKNTVATPEDKKKGGIPVFLSSDNSYAPFVATTICSIMDHTSSFINFYILDGGITGENAEKIRASRRIFPDCNIEFIKIDTQKRFKNFPTRLHFSIDMYTRFLIPELKPDLKKVIYSDVDVIFNGDVRELMDEDLDGRSLGAVPFTFGYLNPDKSEIASYHERLKLSDSHKYFESGMLVLDNELWKKNNFTEKLIRETQNRHPGVILTPDQDVFNIVFENDYKELDNKYIVVPHRSSVMRTDIAARRSVDNPFIIHYAGSDKPWNNPEMDMAEYFWKYAKMTLFYEDLLYGSRKHGLSAKKQRSIYISGGVMRDKLWFMLFFPRAFVKKYISLLLNSSLRQPARKIYYAARFKRLK